MSIAPPGREAGSDRCRRLRRWTLAVLAAAVLATLVIFGREVLGEGFRTEDIGPMTGLGLWQISPYLALAAAARWLAVTVRQQSLVLLGAVIAAVAGPGILLDALVLNPEFLNFLVLLAVPNLLWGVALVVGAVVALVRWWERRRVSRG